MAVQQNKKSKQKYRQRKAANRYKGFEIGYKCPRCEQPAQSHRVCPSCGHYKGRQIKVVGE